MPLIEHDGEECMAGRDLHARGSQGAGTKYFVHDWDSLSGEECLQFASDSEWSDSISFASDDQPLNLFPNCLTLHRYLSPQRYVYPHPRIMPILFEDGTSCQQTEADFPICTFVDAPFIHGACFHHKREGKKYDSDASNDDGALSSWNMLTHEMLDHEQWLIDAQCSNTVMSMLLASGREKFFSPKSIYAMFSISDGLLSVEQVLILIIDVQTKSINEIQALNREGLRLHLQREYEHLAMVRSMAQPTSSVPVLYADQQTIKKDSIGDSGRLVVIPNGTNCIDGSIGQQIENNGEQMGSVCCLVSHDEPIEVTLIRENKNFDSGVFLPAPAMDVILLTPPTDSLEGSERKTLLLSAWTTEMQGCISKGNGTKRKRKQS